MTSLAADITVRHNETKNRPIMTIRQYLTKRGYCVVNGEYIDIVNHILAIIESIDQVQAEVDAMNTTKEAEGDEIITPEFEEV